MHTKRSYVYVSYVFHRDTKHFAGAWECISAEWLLIIMLSQTDSYTIIYVVSIGTKILCIKWSLIELTMTIFHVAILSSCIMSSIFGMGEGS